MKCWIWSMAL